MQVQQQRQQNRSTQALEQRRPWATPKREDEDGDILAPRTLGGGWKTAISPLADEALDRSASDVADEEREMSILILWGSHRRSVGELFLCFEPLK